MDLIPELTYLPDTPAVLIKDIKLDITIFNQWALSPGDREAELPKWKKQIEDKILLTTDHEMGAVWKKLEDLEGQHTNPDFDEAVTSFYRAIYSALYGQTPWVDLTPKAREIRHDDIIRMMRRLARDIEHYDLDQRDQVAYNPNKPGSSCLVHYDDGSPEKEKLGEIISFQNAYINQTGIGISDLLQKHAYKLEQQKRHHEPLTKKTIAPGKDLLHFIGSLAIYNKTRYGKHHAAIISRLASLYFPDAETDPTKIRLSIKVLNL